MIPRVPHCLMRIIILLMICRFDISACLCKEDPTSVQSVDLIKLQPTNASCAKSTLVALLGSHCKRTNIQPKDQKKSKTFLPNDEELRNNHLR